MKAAGAFEGLPRELRTRHNMGTVYCENRNGATQQTLFSGPRALRFHPDTRLLGPGLDHHRLALSFGPALEPTLSRLLSYAFDVETRFHTKRPH